MSYSSRAHSTSPGEVIHCGAGVGGGSGEKAASSIAAAQTTPFRLSHVSANAVDGLIWPLLPTNMFLTCDTLSVRSSSHAPLFSSPKDNSFFLDGCIVHFLSLNPTDFIHARNIVIGGGGIRVSDVLCPGVTHVIVGENAPTGFVATSMLCTVLTVLPLGHL